MQAVGGKKLNKKRFSVVLLSHNKDCSIIGEEELDFRVRNGVGYTLFSMDTKPDLNARYVRAKYIIDRKRRKVLRNKTNGLLVPVSWTYRYAYTSGLSTM